ncbi:hypothetical protein HY285_03040 [Candidatus Peregrinibacteria bacterium]|nr:hypothetical protein [Candidatus Peregrinibacteria bacterium]MBI3816492.1 hypothetical protein [Candidatus Peregrinibacteria bacterium]
MPLKHRTETLLIALLAIVMMLTGFLITTLPPLPAGFLPSIVLCTACLAYAGLLHPLLKRNRADNAFRLLHLAPACLIALWLALGLLVRRSPSHSSLWRAFLGGWSLLPVTIIFVLIVAFCFQVIRRRALRLTILASLYVAHVSLGIASTVQRWNPPVTAMLWQGSVWQALGVHVPRESIHPAQNGGVQMSDGIDWGKRLADDLERRRERLPLRITGRRHPRRLPSAGPGLDSTVILILAAYATILHVRVKKRSAVQGG